MQLPVQYQNITGPRNSHCLANESSKVIQFFPSPFNMTAPQPRPEAFFFDLVVLNFGWICRVSMHLKGCDPIHIFSYRSCVVHISWCTSMQYFSFLYFLYRLGPFKNKKCNLLLMWAHLPVPYSVIGITGKWLVIACKCTILRAKWILF